MPRIHLFAAVVAFAAPALAQSTTPRLHPETAVTGDDYPRDAMRAGAEGTTRVRVTVGVDGRVSSCTVARSSGNADLDAHSCALATHRWRFDPATTSAGPVPADVTYRFFWRMAKASSVEPDAPAPR